MPRKDKTLKLNHIVVNRSAWWFLINIGEFFDKTQQISRFIGKSWTAGHLHFFFSLRTSKILPKLNVLIFSTIWGSKCSYFVLNCNIFFYGWKSTLKAFRCLCIPSFFYSRTCVHARHVILMVLHVLYQVIIGNEIYLMCDALCDDCLPRSFCYFFFFLRSFCYFFFFKIYYYFF